MAHHAFYVASEREAGIAAAVTYLETERGLIGVGNPDIIIERHGLFRAEDARRIAQKAGLQSLGEHGKAIVIAANRIFHEAQNVLLKTFEEPVDGTTLILVIPSEGDLIPTLRSRVQVLPHNGPLPSAIAEEAEAFWKGNASDREQVVEALLKDAKSDDEDEKVDARAAARRFAEGLAIRAHGEWRKTMAPDLHAFLADLDRLIPILSDRSAPLKPILEHILITAPGR